MFERFTDRARRVVVLAQEEARLLKHNYIGTEHLLLGLIQEGNGVAAKALESLGIGLDAVRERVTETVGEGEETRSGHIPFTPRAKKVLELSLREALQLGHSYIGTEHILLGLLREGEGVAAQVLVGLGTDINEVRRQVIALLSGTTTRVATASGLANLTGRRDRGQLDGLRARLAELEARMLAIEGRAGTGPDEAATDKEIAQARADRQKAVEEQGYERAAELRDLERELVAGKKSRLAAWEAAHPDLPTLAGKLEAVTAEIARLTGLLRRHGIEPGEADDADEAAG